MENGIENSNMHNVKKYLTIMFKIDLYVKVVVEEILNLSFRATSKYYLLKMKIYISLGNLKHRNSYTTTPSRVFSS